LLTTPALVPLAVSAATQRHLSRRRQSRISIVLLQQNLNFDNLLYPGQPAAIGDLFRF
jgi:hypothetical protein